MPSLTRQLLVLALLTPLPALAATSTRDVASPLSGNGHNVTFDGRLFVVTRSTGWDAMVLRPERAVIGGGFVSVADAFSPAVLVQPTVSNENALAICEADPARTPFRCDASGAASAGGAFNCYDLFVIDSDALLVEARTDVLRRRNLFVRVRNPGTPDAAIEQFQWRGTTQVLSTTLRGIEPTVTRDGRLLLWQGDPSNDGRIDFLMYSYNPNPCAVTGWSTPRNLSAMYNDPNAAVRGYRLAERQLRASTGEPYPATVGFNGAYPWLFPDGDALIFTAVNMPCRSTENPPGCGPRRNAISVIGYPTNWGLAHVDGAVNPDTDNTVRLFFSSPGPMRALPLPVTPGRDVWPFFGSNTANYTELIFDDGLDGNYGGIWHLNEGVALNGTFNRATTPDTSGFFNTGRLVGGATFPLRNNGFVGKAIEFNGSDGRVEVANAASLNPVNALTVEMRVRPTVDPNCGAGNNFRWLLRKGTAYNLVLEDDRQVHARVGVGSGEYEVWSGMPLPVGAWTHVAFTYDGATGRLALFLNGTEVASTRNAPGTLAGSTEVLRIGGPGARALCPATGDGSFQGTIDEVAVSRIVRYGVAMPPVDAGFPDSGPRDSGMMIRDTGPVADVPLRDDSVPPVDSLIVIPDTGAGEDVSSAVDTGTTMIRDGGTADARADARRDGSFGPPTMTGCACRTSLSVRPVASFAALGGVLLAMISVRRRRRPLR